MKKLLLSWQIEIFFIYTLLIILEEISRKKGKKNRKKKLNMSSFVSDWFAVDLVLPLLCEIGHFIEYLLAWPICRKRDLWMSCMIESTRVLLYFFSWLIFVTVDDSTKMTRSGDLEAYRTLEVYFIKSLEVPS